MMMIIEFYDYKSKARAGSFSTNFAYFNYYSRFVFLELRKSNFLC